MITRDKVDIGEPGCLFYQVPTSPARNRDAFASEALAPPNVPWPKPTAPLPSRLADRESECRLFLDLLSAHSTVRILLIHGASDRGKSLLLAEFERQAQALSPAGLRPRRFQGRPVPTRSAFRSCRRTWRGSSGLPGSSGRSRGDCRGIAPLGVPPGSDRNAVRSSSCSTRNEDATHESRRWVEQSLFGLVRRIHGLRIVVSGQQVPVPDAAARSGRHCPDPLIAADHGPRSRGAATGTRSASRTPRMTMSARWSRRRREVRGFWAHCSPTYRPRISHGL